MSAHGYKLSTLIAVMALALSSIGAAPAQAQDEELVAVSAAEDHGAINLTGVIEGTAPGAVVDLPDASVALPANGTSTIVMEGHAGDTVAVALPQEEQLQAERLVSDDLPRGVAAYASSDGVTTHIPLVREDGSVQVTSVLQSDAAPEEFEYAWTLPSEATVTVTESGEVLALDASGSLIIGVAAPWAVDAEGEQVPTWFEASHDGFTQVVDHRGRDSAYPIVADPYMGRNLINYALWSGYNVEVHVTAWMAQVSNGVAVFQGWDELTSKMNTTYRNRLLGDATYRQQWDCHASGKAAIGFAGFLGLDPRPAWGLEAGRGTTWNYTHYWTHQCSW